ncbi:MAG: hypothetical protein K6U11_12545 [bacterium]|nr:hypothetical protein [bacterium]
MQIPTLTPHPLKKQIQDANLKYWQLVRLLGRSSESMICRMLNGILPMPPKIEQDIRRILAELEQPGATK